MKGEQREGDGGSLGTALLKTWGPYEVGPWGGGRRGTRAVPSGACARACEAAVAMGVRQGASQGRAQGRARMPGAVAQRVCVPHSFQIKLAIIHTHTVP